MDAITAAAVSQAHAAWVQAVAATVAIVAALIIAGQQTQQASKRERERRDDRLNGLARIVDRETRIKGAELRRAQTAVEQARRDGVLISRHPSSPVMFGCPMFLMDAILTDVEFLSGTLGQSVYDLQKMLHIFKEQTIKNDTLMMEHEAVSQTLKMLIGQCDVVFAVLRTTAIL